MTQEKRIWLGRDRALFLGELPPARLHAHAAPVLLIGLSGPISLTLPDGRQETCHSALVDAGVEHALDTAGEYMASLYLEPDAPEAGILKSELLRNRPVVFDVLPTAIRHRGIERRLQSFDLRALLPSSALGRTGAISGAGRRAGDGDYEIAAETAGSRAWRKTVTYASVHRVLEFLER